MRQTAAIRVDASFQIGTGHVTRCLTLARVLKKNKVKVEFICRNHEGNLIDFIKQHGFNVHTLPKLVNQHFGSINQITEGVNSLHHSSWLGVTQEQDINECSSILSRLRPDWLIVDHYGIDKTWEIGLHGLYGKLMVVDDLADREHSCEVLLDQTFMRHERDYENLVPSTCLLLTGSKYALLRPEFSHWRERSLKRRKNAKFDKLLITMGGIDKDNTTAKVIDHLENNDLHGGLEIKVVIGPLSPHLPDILRKAKRSNLKLLIESNVSDMAKLMSNSDFCIGASGTTTWERCCLGLPTIQIISAHNQDTIARNVSRYGAAISIQSADISSLDYHINRLKRDAETFTCRSSSITDGKGAELVLDHLLC